MSRLQSTFVFSGWVGIIDSNESFLLRRKLTVSLVQPSVRGDRQRLWAFASSTSDEFLLPGPPAKTMRDVVFRKLPGTDEFIINEEFLAYCDYVLCTAPSAGRDPAILRLANDHYKYQLKLYKRRSQELVSSKTGDTLRPWRDELAEVLEAWRVQGPGAPNMRHKRKSRSSDLKDDDDVTLQDDDFDSMNEFREKHACTCNTARPVCLR